MAKSASVETAEKISELSQVIGQSAVTLGIVIIGGLILIALAIKIWRNGKTSWEAAKPTIFTLQGLFISIPWFFMAIAFIKILEVVKFAKS